MTRLLQDVRFALRDLRKGFLITALAVLSLAIAIAGNTTVFGLVNAFLFRPLPYPEAERIVVLGEREENSPRTLTASTANLVDWRERNRSFIDLAGFRAQPMSLGAGERPEPVLAAQVSPGFYELLGATPLRGRLIEKQDGYDEESRVVVLSYRFFEERFAPSEDPLGGTLVLNRKPFTIVGILPDDFEFFDPRVRLWTPLPLSEGTLSRDRRDTIVVGRLRPGVTMEQAKADMAAVHEELVQEFPESNRGFVVDTLNLRYEIPDERGRMFFALLQGAVVFVLLIACVNIANLLLSRQQGRRREIALRSALGAGRLRIVRQLLTESVVIAAAGGALGLVLGAIGLRLCAAAFANVVAKHWTPTLDLTVVAVTLGLAALSGVLFGLSPAIMSFKLNLSQVLREGGRGSGGASRRFLSRALVIAEIALSVVLLGGGSVLVQAFVELRHSDPGFEADDLLAVATSLPEGEDRDRVALTERLVERAASVAGTVSVVAASSLPQNFYVTTTSFIVDDQPLGPGEPNPRAVVLSTGPEYLETLRFTLLGGRFFETRDRLESAPVAVVSQSIAERHWSGASPIGNRITIQETSREIVGVVEDIRQSMFQQSASFQGAIYLPLAQAPVPAPFLLVRCRIDPHTLAGTLRNELSAVDPMLAIGQIETMQEFVDQFFVGVNVFNAILSGFAVLALMLAALGTYGVLAYNVSQRSQELGVRMALGAAPSRILGMVTRQGAILSGVGLLLGTPGVLLLTRVLERVLVYSPPIEPLTIVVVFGVLLASTMAASYVPARRAASVDPVIVLRSE
ncbi:MAG TPA: ABC transporter permease [Vicinamibacteria bacterium]|nr:ABC transporter permease [Vicinamibacteria bacterium]